MSLDLETPGVGKEIASRYGRVTFLFDWKNFAGCSYFSPVNPSPTGFFFFKETILFGGGSLPVFDLDRCFGRFFHFDEMPVFPVAIVLKLDAVNAAIKENLRAACESEGGAWDGRYLACRLTREASVVSDCGKRSLLIPGPIGKALLERGFTGFSFLDDGSIGWRVDVLPFIHAMITNGVIRS
jgi:hypothetical protein